MLSNHDVFDPFALDDGKPAPARAAEVFVPGRVPLQTLQRDQVVRGIYRIGRCLKRVSRNSASYRLVELIDGASSLRCYGWKPELVHAPGVSEGTIVTAAFVTYEYDGSVRGRLGSLTVVADPKPEDVIATLPSALCPISGVVDRLRTAVASIREPLLREFVARVFADYTVARRYFQVPASFGDHHSKPGGHADHCTEMGVDSAQVQSISEMNRDLAVVQSLFHDVGKIETHLPSQRSAELHRMINHEALTLYLLSAPLHWLAGIWPDGARALIVGWAPAWARNGRGQPVTYPPGELVRGLDRTSQGSSMQRQHGPASGGICELSRQRAVWSPMPPPGAPEGSARVDGRTALRSQ